MPAVRLAARTASFFGAGAADPRSRMIMVDSDSATMSGNSGLWELQKGDNQWQIIMDAQAPQ